MLATVPYTTTGPAITNSLAASPSTKPSLLNSMAGEDMALAKPVMGTSVPAPAFLASFWYQPSPVVTTESNTSVTEHQAPASSFVSPRLPYQSIRACPTTQISPPTKKAIGSVLALWLGGELSLSILLYSLGVFPILHRSFFGFSRVLCPPLPALSALSGLWARPLCAPLGRPLRGRPRPAPRPRPPFFPESAPLFPVFSINS